MKDVLKAIAILPVLYFGVASAVWQIRNPLANRSTCFSYASDVLAFRKLPEFQP